VKPHRILDCVVTADGRELVLSQRGDVFHIHVDRYELMTSRANGSEDELARLALAALGPRPAPRVLVGGLGMGFTVRAALDALAARPQSAVEVAEVFPAVVEWNRGPLGGLARHPLADPRVSVVEADVADVIASGAGRYDAILLDVDNGPEAFTLRSNAHLYSTEGLARLGRTLTAGGILAVWSSSAAPDFVRRLRRAGFEPRIERVSPRGGGGRRSHTLFLARRPQ